MTELVVLAVGVVAGLILRDVFEDVGLWLAARRTPARPWVSLPDPTLPALAVRTLPPLTPEEAAYRTRVIAGLAHEED